MNKEKFFNESKNIAQNYIQSQDGIVKSTFEVFQKVSELKNELTDYFQKY